MTESVIDKLAQLAYTDSVEMTKRLYKRQEHLEKTIRVLVQQTHQRHRHVSERWEDCYMGLCTQIRQLLGEHVEPD
jgi:hypothetical protein